MTLSGFWAKYKGELRPIASLVGIIGSVLVALRWILGQAFWRRPVPLWVLPASWVVGFLIVRFWMLRRPRTAAVPPGSAMTARLAQVFHGAWDKGYWELDGEGPKTEKVEFDGAGTYYMGGKPCYVARDVAIDSERRVIRFSLFRTSGSFFQEEYLAGADRKAALDRQDRFVGSCSHGHRIEYRRVVR